MNYIKTGWSHSLFRLKWFHCPYSNGSENKKKIKEEASALYVGYSTEFT
jgi:hypothetical protein